MHGWMEVNYVESCIKDILKVSFTLPEPDYANFSGKIILISINLEFPGFFIQVTKNQSPFFISL